MGLFEKAQLLLRERFGYGSFRPGQEQAVRAVLEGRDVLAVMPTGAGKSICYQIPAAALEGMAIVVSPLISLMSDQVRACREAGISAVFLNSTLELEEKRQITRAMLVAILYRAAGATAQEKSTFADVAADAWYTEEVAWAQSEGIINGVGDNCFAPERPVTREEFATILWRYAGKPEAETAIASFADSENVSDWALDAMNWAVSSGIINGTDGNRLDPQGTTTRAQAAAMLCRFLAK